MKTLIKILCLSMLWFSCEEKCSDIKACDYDSLDIDSNYDRFNCDYFCHCEEQHLGWVELFGECYNIERRTELYLNDNQLTGEIPPEIGDLTNLEVLHLRYNQLTGEIPSEIGNLTNLRILNLYSNELTGEIPPEIGNLTILDHLNLSNNQLTGGIPETICSVYESLPYWGTLDISNNKLCPPYPECLSEENTGYQDTSNCP
jgi:hypothetical protein